MSHRPCYWPETDFNLVSGLLVFSQQPLMVILRVFFFVSLLVSLCISIPVGSNSDGIY